ncbi:MAG: O-antigen ligase family protein [Candidatus Pacebacteria bacterium]|nr:O-antigen ligase family protein [Candidatus Paceibacterota bacterium]
MNRNTQNILLYTIIALIYGTLFVPLIVSTSLFFPYITGKAFIFRLFVEIATILYIVLAAFDRSFIPKRGTILTAVFTFTAVLGIATLTSVDVSKSFWSNFERMEGYITILHLFFYFVVVTSVLRTKKAWYALFNTSLAVSIVLGLRAFAEYDTSRDSAFLVEAVKGIKYFFESLFGTLGSTIRIAGPLGNSSYLGVYSLIHIFIAGLLFVTLKSARKFKEAPVSHIAYTLAALFNIIVLYNTGTRGSFVGLVAGFFIMALIPLVMVLFGKGKIKETVSHSTKNVIKKFSIVSLVVVVVAVGFLGMNKDSNFVKSSDLLNRFSSLITFDVKNVFETQGKARTLLWGMAWKGVEEKPILGWGQDNFPYVFAKHYDPKMYAQEQWFDRTHNVFFDWLIAGGILGLLSYLGLFFALLYVLWKKVQLNKENVLYDILEKSVITGLLTAYFVHNIFIFDNLSSYILFFILLAYVNQQGSLVSKISSKSEDKHSSKGISVLDSSTARIAIVAVAIVTFGYSVNAAVYKPYMAGTTLIKALQLSQPEAAKVLGEQAASPKNVLALFQQALDYNTFANTEIRERLAEITPTILNGSKDAELITAYTTLVATEYQNAIKETPNDPRPLVFLSLYLQKFGLFKEAEVYIDKAIALSPTKQSFLFQKGIIEVSLGQFPKAVETFKTAYDLETTSKESRVLYALSLIYADRIADAKQILNGEVDLVTDERIIDAFLQKKQYSEIISIAQIKIASDPNNPQTYMSLAGLYLKMNKRTEAIAQIKKVIELSPDFKATGEFYINEILAGRDPSQPTVK